MLLVYVVASNGYASNPTVSSSFHGATFPTKEACLAAAQSVAIYAPAATEDISKSGVVTVCAPAQPPLPPEPPPAQASAAAPMQQSPFPAYPPARPGH